jgi:hypothetical protein
MPTSSPPRQLPSKSRRCRILRSLRPRSLRLLSHLPTHQLRNSSQTNDSSGKVVIGARPSQSGDFEVLDWSERYVGAKEKERGREEGSSSKWHCVPQCWPGNNARTAAVPHGVKQHYMSEDGKENDSCTYLINADHVLYTIPL